nr:serine hydrolase [Phyllobacterium sp. 628]
MSVRITRRVALAGSMLVVPALALSIRSATAVPAAGQNLEALFKDLEKATGARLGVSALDTGSGKRIDYRATELFAMCSTFKFFAAAAILSRVDRKKEQLDRVITYKKSDLVEYSPVTEKHVEEGDVSGCHLRSSHYL